MNQKVVDKQAPQTGSVLSNKKEVGLHDGGTQTVTEKITPDIVPDTLNLTPKNKTRITDSATFWEILIAIVIVVVLYGESYKKKHLKFEQNLVDYKSLKHTVVRY